MTPNQNKHQSVLLDKVVELLAPQTEESYLDMTAGYGGHAGAVLEHIGEKGRATLIDRDEQAIETLRSRFWDDPRVRLVKADFLSAADVLSDERQGYDMVLLDLGMSSPQVDQPERGFSFRYNGPLDMRMDRSQTVSAETIINTYPERQLADLIYRYGEEPQAKRIASAIVEGRPLKTTGELADLVDRTVQRRNGKIHPATRTFQALRIAVNNELEQIEQVLPLVLNLLKPGGRLAVISFHSLEDRIVKRFLRANGGDRYDSLLEILTKKPITSSDQDVINPRARSAKLRAAVKIKTQAR